MMASAVMNEDEWPSLGDAKNEGWEMLHGGVGTTTAAATAFDSNSTAFDIVDAPPAHHLRHAASTPNLRHVLACGGSGDQDSFSLVSGPASVTSIASFRDAILAAGAPVGAVVAPPPPQQQERTSQQRPASRKKIQPKIVVVASPPRPALSRRTSKSTGDLMSLVVVEEGVDDHDDEDESGAYDAMEFYHRKASGSVARSNGQKMRPDEAKRKGMILQKKRAQQEQQQQK